MNNSEKLAQTPAAHEGLFGVSTAVDQAQVVVIGVPWEPTASYGRGTSETPGAIVPASHQLDFFEPMLGRAFAQEVAMLPTSDSWLALNRRCSDLARPIIAAGLAENETMAKAQAEVNKASQRLNRELYLKTKGLLEQGKNHRSSGRRSRQPLRPHPGLSGVFSGNRHLAHRRPSRLENGLSGFYLFPCFHHAQHHHPRSSIGAAGFGGHSRFFRS